MNALDWLNAQQRPVRSVTPLAGLTGGSRLITLTNGEKWVWRQQTVQATAYGVNYYQEAQLLQALDFLPFTPKPYFFTAEFSLLSFQNGTVPTAFNDKLLCQLAHQLATLHTLDLQTITLSTPIAKLDLAQRCRFLWQRLPTPMQARPELAPPFEAISPFSQAICHHDLHLGNLVEQGDRLFIIDWEYAAISDPALEIALFLNSNRLSSAQQALFFQHYFAKFPLNHTAFLEKVTEYQPMVEKLNRLWFAIYQECANL